MSKIEKIRVTAFYRFIHLENYRELKNKLLNRCKALGIKGTILLAEEGINSTIAGTNKAIDLLFAEFDKYPALKNMPSKSSWADKMPFYRLKIKLKKEIVTMGINNIDPVVQSGEEVLPSKWNDLISDPNVITVDTRNEYEISIGSFKHAINPHTENFRDFPEFVENNLSAHKDKKVAMYCTGGIRCEKSTSYLKQQGFKDVYHLKGGILKYLEDVPKEESLWEGECFVFDNRVAVDHSLKIGQYSQCHGCRRPISAEDMASEHFVKEICCPHCYDELTPTRLARRQERKKQVDLAVKRNHSHIGAIHN